MCIHKWHEGVTAADQPFRWSCSYANFNYWIKFSQLVNFLLDQESINEEYHGCSTDVPLAITANVHSKIILHLGKVKMYFLFWKVRMVSLGQMFGGNSRKKKHHVCHWSQPAELREGKILLVKLISFYDRITHRADLGKPLDVIFLDFKSKGLDTVSHSTFQTKCPAHSWITTLSDG